MIGRFALGGCIPYKGGAVVGQVIYFLTRQNFLKFFLDPSKSAVL